MYGDKKLSKITAKDIDDYKTLRLRDTKTATVNREIATLRQIFNLARRWKKFFGDTPVSTSKLLLEHNQKEKLLTYEEETKLLSHYNPYLRAIIITALNTGMRKMEILSLNWSNLDLKNGVITIDQTNTKTKKARRIQMIITMRILLKEPTLKKVIIKMNRCFYLKKELLINSTLPLKVLLRGLVKTQVSTG